MVSPWEQRVVRRLTRLPGMTVYQGAPLIHVVCPECHSAQSVRSPDRYEAVCYLCHKCLHFWDASPTLTPGIRSFALELS